MAGPDRFDGEKALGHLHYLALEIGARPKGSPGERMAADYVADWFSGLGLVVHRQAFPVRTYRTIETSLEILQPALGAVPCEQLGLAQDSPPEGVVGDILAVDGPDLASIGPEVRGKIVLVLGRFAGGSLARLVRFAPLGVISIVSELAVSPTRTSQSTEARTMFGAVPTVVVSHQDGISLLQKGAERARIVARSQEADASSQNVIGELVGFAYPDEIIVVGAHYDTVIGTQGASDNAGGTALILELARLFAARGSRRTLHFVAFGAEEGGLCGSLHYVRKLLTANEQAPSSSDLVPGQERTGPERHLLCVNIDVQGVLLGENRAHILGPEDLGAAVRLLSREIGPTFQVTDELCSSDGNPFSAKGIPSVSFVRKGPTSSHLHTADDQIGYVGPGPLAAQGKFIETFLQRYVAGARAFPFERTIPGEQQKKLREYLKRGGLVGF